jgi:hypothetical protein
MAKVLDVIWGEWEQKYLSENQKKDSTALSTNRPTGKSQSFSPGQRCAASKSWDVRSTTQQFPSLLVELLDRIEVCIHLRQCVTERLRDSPQDDV